MLQRGKCDLFREVWESFLDVVMIELRSEVMWASLGWGQIEGLGARTERIMIQSQEAIQRLGGRGSMAYLRKGLKEGRAARAERGGGSR